MVDHVRMCHGHERLQWRWTCVNGACPAQGRCRRGIDPGSHRHVRTRLRYHWTHRGWGGRAADLKGAELGQELGGQRPQLVLTVGIGAPIAVGAAAIAPFIAHTCLEEDVAHARARLLVWLGTQVVRPGGRTEKHLSRRDSPGQEHVGNTVPGTGKLRDWGIL